MQDGPRFVPDAQRQAAVSTSLPIAALAAFSVGVVGGFSGFAISVILVPLPLLAERTVLRAELA